MRYSIKRSPSDLTQFQMVLEAQNNDEDEVLNSLYLHGSIIARGETPKGHYELVLGTTPEVRE